MSLWVAREGATVFHFTAGDRTLCGKPTDVGLLVDGDGMQEGDTWCGVCYRKGERQEAERLRLALPPTERYAHILPGQVWRDRLGDQHRKRPMVVINVYPKGNLFAPYPCATMRNMETYRFSTIHLKQLREDGRGALVLTEKYVCLACMRAGRVSSCTHPPTAKPKE